MYFLAWRDIAVRYKQTVIGVAWAIHSPGTDDACVCRLPPPGRHRRRQRPGRSSRVRRRAAVAVLFDGASREASSSLLGNSNLISKVYFPRLIVPFAAVTTALVDFVITLVLLALLMAWYQVAPTMAAPGAAALRRCSPSCCRSASGLLLAALNVEVPRFPLRGAVHRPGRTVRVADRVHHGGRARALAHALLRSTRWSA